MKETEKNLEKLINIREKLKTLVRSPKLWAGVSIITLGTLAVVLHKNALKSKEISLLREDNKKLGNQLNQAWYHLGKVVNNSNQHG